MSAWPAWANAAAYGDPKGFGPPTSLACQDCYGLEGPAPAAFFDGNDLDAYETMTGRAARCSTCGADLV